MIEILEFFFFGIAFGLAGGLSPGPTMTLVIAQTLRHGRREGIKVAIAPLLTDAPIVILAMFVMRFIETDRLLAGVSVIGAMFLLYLAYESFNARAPQLGAENVNPASVQKGVLANFFNPHPWMFWLTVGGPVMQRAIESSIAAALLFLVSQYVCLVGAKILIAAVVERGRGRLGRGYSIVMRLLAVTLVIFAVLFLRQAMGYLGLISG